MGKKINCKHGLTNKQEIEARRLKAKIEENDTETMAEISKLRKEWIEEGKEPRFINFLLKNGHVVLCSAIMRITDEKARQRMYLKK